MGADVQDYGGTGTGGSPSAGRADLEATRRADHERTTRRADPDVMRRARPVGDQSRAQYHAWEQEQKPRVVQVRGRRLDRDFF